MLGGAIVLFTLALLRIVSLLGHLRRALRREHVLRGATAALVSAADRGGVRDAALDAAVDLLDQPGTRAWRIDGDPGGTIAQATDDLDVATFLDAAELALFPDGTTGIDLLAGPSLRARDARRALDSDARAHRPAGARAGPRGSGRSPPQLAPSPRTIASLESLAKTMALALDRLDVGEVHGRATQRATAAADAAVRLRRHPASSTTT